MQILKFFANSIHRHRIWSFHQLCIGKEMKHPCFMSSCFPNLLIGILLLCLTPGMELALAPTSANDSDYLVLLDFKNQITQDPNQIKKSWNDSVHFCNWVGVTCSPYIERVMILNLEAKELVGTIPPSIGNLTFLTGINLRQNSFHGEIPQDMGRLLRLQHLNLTSNSFGGKVPTNLTHCTELRVLDLIDNELVGEIPGQLSSLLKLFYLGLAGNHLTGNIPAWIGNFTNLFAISLSNNNLEGNIPNEFGRLSRLGFFQLGENEFSGTIPSPIYNISSIFFFSVAHNFLHGSLPPDIGFTLPNLKVLAGGINNFNGNIPVSLSNASRLEVLDFGINSFTGTLPTELGSLKSLSRLYFDANRLGNEELGDLNFLHSLANCSNLEVLGLGGNRFGGELPSSIANLSSHLRKLTLYSNLIHGSIPFGIENLVNLTLLGMDNNSLSGIIPDSLGKLQKLEELHLNINKLSGPIPYSIGNLTSLTILRMDENRFEGNITTSLGNCQNLLNLNLSCNNLSGDIPTQVMGLSSLSISLAMSHNSLTGSLPMEVGSLKNLEELDISDNKLSGEIPSSLGSCVRLERLYLEDNLFRGMIPQSIEALRGLNVVDLSCNNLSGKIPDFLGMLPNLRLLNLSFNDFEGEVSREGKFANASVISILGNDRLCGGNQELSLPACSKGKDQQSSVFLSRRVIIPVAGVFIFFIILSCICALRYMIKIPRRPSADSSSNDWLSEISYLQLARSTNGFSVENLIGSGSFGSVFKGVLNGDDNIVAVKVLNLQQQGASKSFKDECKALKSVRHRNLLKIITACSSVDHLGNDFKGLVFPFMSNGSLDQWVHPRIDEQEQPPAQSLSFMQRLGIAIDVASGLGYLHHGCETPIVHCDLKPSNILLDDDMTAHVGDFGLARFLFDDSDPSISQTLSIGLKGSVGYIPPEYGTGSQVSILGDVYSYGIVLLEMFTGKRPTDEIFKDGLSLHNFVLKALPGHAMDIADPSLILEDKNQRDDNRKQGGQMETRAIFHQENSGTSRSKIEECLIEVMEMGLACSGTSPEERVSMDNVAKKLIKIRERYIGFMNQNQNRRNRR